jgi:hypothetical protein
MAGHEADMEAMIDAYKILFQTHEGKKRSPGRPRDEWKYTIKIYVQAVSLVFQGVDWMQLSQDKIEWWVVMNHHTL